MINKQHLAQLLSWVSSRSRTLPLTAISISASAQLAWRRHCIISARGRPPLWRIDIEALGRIVRQQSLLAQPLCLPAYRRALAMQPFGNLRSRICRPQGNKFAEFLVGPAGHGRPRHGGPSTWCHNCRFVRRHFGDRIFFHSGTAVRRTSSRLAKT